MEIFVTAVIVLAVIVALAYLMLYRKAIIFEYQRGLLYRNGKFASILQPGQHWYFVPGTNIQKVDIREQIVNLPGQEVLTSDNISLKVSLVASFKVADPYLAINQVANYQQALYLILQVNLRDVVGSLAVDDLLAKREEIGKIVFEKSAQKAAELGLELSLVNIRDIMFPGELKNIFAQIVNARKEGLAALERARGESAALRNLANAARLLDGNPNLQQLRLLQTLENKSGNTIVLLGESLSNLKKGLGKEVPSEAEQTDKGLTG